MSDPAISTRLQRVSSEHVSTSGWIELFARLEQARFYQHPDWLLAANTHLLEGELEMACVYRQDQLILLLPWMGCRHRHRFCAPTHDHLTLGDALIDPMLTVPQARQALQAALDLAGSSQWDWRIGNVPEHSALVAAARSQPHWRARQVRQSAWFDLAARSTPGSGKLRRNLKRHRGRLEQQGRLQAQWLKAPDELDEGLTRFLELEDSGWKGHQGQGTAINDSAALRGFYQQLLTPGHAGMQAVIALLWLDDRCIAGQFGLISGNCLSLLKIAYDESFSSHSPGSLLLQDTAAHAIDVGLQTLSLVSAPAWADRWHPEVEPVWHLGYYANNTGGRVLHTLDRLKQTARTHLRPAA